MQVLLRLSLFSVLLTVGAFLDCEICMGVKSCRGDWKACPSGKNSCAISIMEHEGDHGNLFVVKKSCVYVDECEIGPIDLTYGEGQFMRENTFCCTGAPCITPPLEFTTIRSMKYNGKICPSCSSLSDVCLHDEEVYCKGSDNYCFGFVTYKGVGANTINSTTKGCTSDSVCATLNKYRGTVLRGSPIKDVQCEPARNVLAKKVPPLSEFTLLALLLMKLLL